jgi:hypothetical protein
VETRAVGHAEDEKPLAFLARANFRRREESALNRAAQSEKVSTDALGAARTEHAADVLDEDEPCPGLDEKPPGRAPQVALVFPAEPLSGEGMGLAGNPPNEAIHKATPASAIEGSGIRPDRRLSHDTVAHLRDQISDAERLPLHTHDWASAWDCQLDGPVKATSAGADGEQVESGIGI